MPAWLVIPKNDGRLQMDNAQVIEAASTTAAATHLYMNAVVLGPVTVFSSDARHHDDEAGPVAHLPAEGQPQ